MIIITTHKGTDFDVLASLIAASVLYLDAKAVLPTSINANLKAFLAIHKDLFDLYSHPDIEMDQVTTFVAVDTHSWSRLEGVDDLRDRQDLEIVVWDHHSEGDIETDQKNISETGAAASPSAC